jgi:hypothetical protein
MDYDLMLLADPGPPRQDVLAVMAEEADIRRDDRLENRYWFAAGGVDVQVNIGTKNPVESVHLLFQPTSRQQVEAVARRSLSLAASLQMRVDDVLWGHEVTDANLAGLLEYWSGLAARTTSVSGTTPSAARPWWRFW